MNVAMTTTQLEPIYSASRSRIEQSLDQGDPSSALAYTVYLASVVRGCSRDVGIASYLAETELLIGRCLAAMAKPSSASRHLERAVRYATDQELSGDNERVLAAAQALLSELT